MESGRAWWKDRRKKISLKKEGWKGERNVAREGYKERRRDDSMDGGMARILGRDDCI